MMIIGKFTNEQVIVLNLQEDYLSLAVIQSGIVLNDLKAHISRLGWLNGLGSLIT